jgi:hypothetical protein
VAALGAPKQALVIRGPFDQGDCFRRYPDTEIRWDCAVRADKLQNMFDLQNPGFAISKGVRFNCESLRWTRQSGDRNNQFSASADDRHKAILDAGTKKEWIRADGAQKVRVRSDTPI